MKAEDKITKARINLILDEPFFGMLITHLKFSERNDLPHKTMATDGVNLFWDRSFVERLSVREISTVFVHEVLHCSLNHCTRRGSRDPERWNEAADYAVNLIIDDSIKAGSRFEWPKCGKLLDEQFRGMSADEIYGKLPPRKGESPGRMGKEGREAPRVSRKAPQGSPGSPGRESKGEKPPTRLRATLSTGAKSWNRRQVRLSNLRSRMNGK